MDRMLAWFAAAYEKRLGRRYRTMSTALELVLARSGADRTLVETGCVRERNDYSAGYSTVLFGEFLTRHGGTLHTVDLSEKNMTLCRRLTKRYAAHVRYHVGDSAAFLAGWGTQHAAPIDLLYLDSFDYPEGPDDALRTASQVHCRAELEAALPFLAPQAVVLIDDGDLPGGGKPRLAKERLAELGWTCVIDDYQTLWTPARP
jgi:predicted O-methyltransferase YrrM